MNKIILIGNLTKPPELNSTQNGMQVCNFDIAVNETRGGQDNVLYFRVSAWRQLGENCAKYLAKGRKVCVSGRIGYHTYQANDGKTRVQLEVMAEDVEFLPSRNDEQPSATTPPPATSNAQGSGYTAVETDDLPF